MILVVKSVGKVSSGRLRKDVNDNCSGVGRGWAIQCNARMSGLKSCLVVDVSINGIVHCGYTVTELVTQLMATPVILK